MIHPWLASRRRQGLRAGYAIGSYALVAALALLGVFLHQTTTRAAAVPLHRICRSWDGKAADSLARLVHGTSDAALRQAGDALFRLRRARRNCREGWLALACQDYQAVIGLHRIERMESPMAKTPCALAMIE